MDVGSSSVRGNNGPVEVLTRAAFVLKSEPEMVEGDDGQQTAEPGNRPEMLNNRHQVGRRLSAAVVVVREPVDDLGQSVSEFADARVLGHVVAPLRRGVRQLLNAAGAGGA